MKKPLTSNINNNNIFINQTKRSQLTKVPSGVSAKTVKLAKGAVAEALIIAVINWLGRNLRDYGLSQVNNLRSARQN